MRHLDTAVLLAVAKLRRVAGDEERRTPRLLGVLDQFSTFFAVVTPTANRDDRDRGPSRSKFEPRCYLCLKAWGVLIWGVFLISDIRYRKI